MKFLELVTGGLWNRGTVANVGALHNVTGKECYRTLYLYGSDFVKYVKENESVEKFEGLHTTDYIVFDFDSDNLKLVRADVIKFVDMLVFGYDVPLKAIRIKFSGNKGYHVSIPIEAITDSNIPRLDYWNVYQKFVEFATIKKN